MPKNKLPFTRYKKSLKLSRSLLNVDKVRTKKGECQSTNLHKNFLNILSSNT